MLVDAHCHLADGAFDPDRDAVLARARAVGVGHIVVIGESIATAERALALARATPGLSATAGVHPHEARHWSRDTEARLRGLLADPAVVAVGETGLDFHYDHSPRDAQRAAFEAQCALAAERRLPVVVHAREADGDAADVLRRWADRLPAVVLHSFSSGRILWDAGRDVGAYFSFSGMITFRNWRPAGPLAELPPERLLVETDAPYLAPVPHRGRRNEPAFVAATAAALAAARGEAPEALRDTLAANARRVFGPRLATTLTGEVS